MEGVGTAPIGDSPNNWPKEVSLPVADPMEMNRLRLSMTCNVVLPTEPAWTAWERIRAARPVPTKRDRPGDDRVSVWSQWLQS